MTRRISSDARSLRDVRRCSVARPVRKPGPPHNATREQRLCKLGLLASSALFVISLWPSLRFLPIGLDDQALIAHFSRASLGEVWSFDQFGHLRPIKNLYFWCWARWPALSWGLRALNLVVAVACSWLVRSSSLRLGLSQLAAASAAALWLLNPTTVTGVAWLSASNYLFALLGALAYVLLVDRAAESGTVRANANTNASLVRTRALGALAHVALLFAALSHELAILTPLWLLFWQLRKPGFTKRRAVSVVIAALVVSVVPAALRISQTAPKLQYRSNLPALQLVASAAHNFEQNLRLWLWPHHSFGVLLSQTSALSLTMSVISWLAALLCAGLLWKLSRRDQLVALAVAWVLLFLLPLVNVVPIGNTPVAQHYLIIPSVGLAWLVARALAAVAPMPLAAAGAAVLLLVWQPTFRQSIDAYASTTSLYEITVANYPDNLEARVNLIAAYENNGQLSQARELLDSSLQLAPDHPGLLKNQLALFFREKRFPEALAVLDQHPQMVSADPELNLRRALVLNQLGRKREAEPLFQRIYSEPGARELRLIAGFQLANLWAQARRFSEAQTLLRNLHAEFPEDQNVDVTLQLIDAALAPGN